jgi:L-gulonolactone oxidase
MQPDAHRFTNWSGTIACNPRNYAEPENEAELAEIVAGVTRRSGTVRAVGSGHSWSNLVLTDDTLISLNKMKRLIRIDREQGLVTVQAGMRLQELADTLTAHDLALLNVGAILEQSVAGAISTGTHGTGLKLGNLSTQIHSLRLVLADGGILEVSPDTNAELLPAAKVSLGCLGIVFEVTLRCVPVYRVNLQAWSAGFETTVDGLLEIAGKQERIRLYWIAGTDRFYINSMNQTNLPATPQSSIALWFRNVFMRHYVLGTLEDIEHTFPHLIGAIGRLEEAVGFERINEVGSWAEELTVPNPPVHIECEYAVPLDKAREAIRTHRNLIERYHLRVTVPTEIRFCAADDLWLSPAYDREVCYIGAYTTGIDFARPYYAAFEPAMKALDGRPHWGKQIAITREEARAMYPMFDRFAEIRERLDPTGTFANAMIRSLFGLD